MNINPTLSAVLISSALLIGCGQEKPAPAPTKPVAPPKPAPVSVAPTGQTAAPPPPGAAAVPATVAAAPAVEEKLPAEKIVLDAVQSFMISKERPPKDINELVQAGFLKSIPPAPPGKKIVFNPANLSVKLENQ